jgi:hypothetical protein
MYESAKKEMLDEAHGHNSLPVIYRILHTRTRPETALNGALCRLILPRIYVHRVKSPSPLLRTERRGDKQGFK